MIDEKNNQNLQFFLQVYHTFSAQFQLRLSICINILTGNPKDRVNGRILESGHNIRYLVRIGTYTLIQQSLNTSLIDTPIVLVAFST